MSLLNRVICGDSCMATITVADTSGKTLIIIWYDHKIYKNFEKGSRDHDKSKGTSTQLEPVRNSYVAITHQPVTVSSNM